MPVSRSSQQSQSLPWSPTDCAPESDSHCGASLGRVYYRGRCDKRPSAVSASAPNAVLNTSVPQDSCALTSRDRERKARSGLQSPQGTGPDEGSPSKG